MPSLEPVLTTVTATEMPPSAVLARPAMVAEYGPPWDDRDAHQQEEADEAQRPRPPGWSRAAGWRWAP